MDPDWRPPQRRAAAAARADAYWREEVDRERRRSSQGATDATPPMPGASIAYASVSENLAADTGDPSATAVGSLTVTVTGIWALRLDGRVTLNAGLPDAADSLLRLTIASTTDERTISTAAASGSNQAAVLTMCALLAEGFSVGFAVHAYAGASVTVDGELTALLIAEVQP